jgi:DNA-binding MarR family transcriptional regulator
MKDCGPLSEALRDFYMASHRALDRLMKAQGASLARTKLLGLIARQPGIRSADIAEAFGQAPRTITEALDGLERDGLIRREPDPQDRRAKRLLTTPAGDAAIEASEPSRRAFIDQVFGVLDEEERNQFEALMRKLNAHLATMDDTDPAERG